MTTARQNSITVDLPKGRAYPIYFDSLDAAPLLLENVGLRSGQILVVSDENVAEHYLERLMDSMEANGWRTRAHIIQSGEASKSADTLSQLYNWALKDPIDRQTPVVALGGGVVGDLAGYMAATLLRGLPLVQIPTSLIAQADSSIGGKTGINHLAGKNLIGAFYQPRLVISDSSSLSTLPKRDFTSGLAEVVKHALIADASFFNWLEAHWSEILLRKGDVVHKMIRLAASIKATVVASDEMESGRRMLLNFGHTFGHAIERASGFGTFTHGEAVALGMRAALHLSSSALHGTSFSMDSVHPEFSRAEALVSRIPISGSVEMLSVPALMLFMQADKKRDAKDLQFVVLDAVGQARVTTTIPAGSIEAAWIYALRSSSLMTI